LQPFQGPVVLSPASLAFTAVGSGVAQRVTVSQSGYSGAFTIPSTTCSGIATIAPVNATTFSVTPVAAGTCDAEISGAQAKSSLPISATTTTVSGS
jgi:hypothetical protein